MHARSNHSAAVLLQRIEALASQFANSRVSEIELIGKKTGSAAGVSRATSGKRVSSEDKRACAANWYI